LAEQAFERALEALSETEADSAARKKVLWARLAFEWGKNDPEHAFAFEERMQSMADSGRLSPNLFRSLAGFAVMGAVLATTFDIPMQALALDRHGGGCFWSIRLGRGAAGWSQERSDAVFEAAQAMGESMVCVVDHSGHSPVGAMEWMADWNGECLLRGCEPSKASWAEALAGFRSALERSRLARSLDECRQALPEGKKLRI
jgi:hypothetical protein